MKQDGDASNPEDYECLRGYRGYAYYNNEKLAYLNEAHPVGSCLTTSTNTNPANSIPGTTWTLVDKEFTPYYTALTQGTHFTIDSTNCSTAEVVMQREGHTVWFRIAYTTKVDLGDTTANILTLNFSKIGLVSLTHTQSIIVGYADGNNCLAMLHMAYDTGLLTSRDYQNLNGTKQLDSGSTVVCAFSQQVIMTDMLDANCNRFTWKRTA